MWMCSEEYQETLTVKMYYLYVYKKNLLVFVLCFIYHPGS